MKNLYLILLFLISLSSIASASETQCHLGASEKIKVEYVEFLENSTAIDIIYPKVKSAKLYAIRLWYGEEGELFAELPFEKTKEGYLAEISVSGEHKDIKILAIYHYSACYAQINTVIKNHRAQQLPNS